MSEEKNEKAQGRKRRTRRDNRLKRWFREMRAELKKVVWPTPKQTVNNTLIALGLMVTMAIVVWAIDQVAGQIFQAIRQLGQFWG
ncbi:MAG: preprotein translocase subunit SecE [Oscillospiraceae bacterium]|nr:preprotein translocase subunit SecE [Oscillospiraceae bacterium]